MSAFVLKREYALQLPTSYVDVDRDEMEYIDGGDFSYRDAGMFVLGLMAAAVGSMVKTGVSNSWIASVITKAVAGWVTSAIDTATLAIMYIPSWVAKTVAFAVLGGALSYGAYQLYQYGKAKGKW